MTPDAGLGGSRGVLPGLFLAGILAAVSALLVRWLAPLSGSVPLSPVLLAVLLGLVIRNSVGVHRAFQPGLTVALRSVLKIGVALLGIRLSLLSLAGIGFQAVPLVVATVTAALVVVLGLGRWLQIPRRLALLIAAGTGICGISAIVAAAPIVGAKDHETSYAVTIIALFGTLALFAYPYLAHGVLDEPHLAGFFLGTAIHDTSQVVAAGLAYADLFSQPAALDTAVVTKLIRNLGLIVVIPLMGALGSTGPGAPARWPMVPLFVLGFLGMALLRTTGDAVFAGGAAEVWVTTVAAIQTAAVAALVVAMAAVGLNTQVRQVATLGLKPLAAGLVAAVAVGSTSLLLITLGEGLGVLLP